MCRGGMLIEEPVDLPIRSRFQMFADRINVPVALRNAFGSTKRQKAAMKSTNECS